MRHGAQSGAMRWADVVEVVAFKRDLLTYDLLCLLVRDEQQIIELDEEMEGYAAVEDVLLARLGISIVWKLEVLFPAFKTKPTPLFQEGRSLWPVDAEVD